MKHKLLNLLCMQKFYNMSESALGQGHNTKN